LIVSIITAFHTFLYSITAGSLGTLASFSLNGGLFELFMMRP
jgi:hypothetical protein